MPRRSRYRPFLVILALAALASGPWWAASASASPGARAELDLGTATAIRVRAEARLEELNVEKAALDARRAETAADAESIAEELASARASMRDRAVAAYVGDATDQALSAVFDPGTAVDAADRRVMLVSRFGVAADDADRYRRLKADTDPALVELALAIDDLDARIAAATDSLVQARTVEADVERAAERARRQAIAAAATSTTRPEPSSGAPRTPAPVTATPPPAAPPSNVPAPSSSSAPATSAAPLPDPPPGGPTEEQWAALRRCESGGNYQIVSANGRYRGAYQFDFQTWAAVGGSGDPAAAPPAEQDLRAKILYSVRGARAWPTCGIHLR